MRLYDILDEQGRFCGFKATTEKPKGEVQASHTFSYAYQRRLLVHSQEMHNPRNLINYQVYVSVHMPVVIDYPEYVQRYAKMGYFE